MKYTHKLLSSSGEHRYFWDSRSETIFEIGPTQWAHTRKYSRAYLESYNWKLVPINPDLENK